MVTTIAALGFAAVVSVVAVIALMAFLTTRELAIASHSRLSLRIAKFLSIGIVPLVMAFVTIVAVKIVELL